MMKYINCKFLLLLLAAGILLFGLSGCYEPDKDEEKLQPHVTVWNNTDNNISVLLLPAGLPLKYASDNKYYSSIEITGQSADACYYYESREWCKFFSFSDEMDVYIFDSNTYADYSHAELIAGNRELAHVTVNAEILQQCDGFMTVERDQDEFMIVLLNQE